MFVLVNHFTRTQAVKYPVLDSKDSNTHFYKKYSFVFIVPSFYNRVRFISI